MDTQVYFRKAFSVEAVQVTEENINEVAEWCEGQLHTDPEGRYIRVKVHKPMSPRQTKAYVGDWLLRSERGFKVYTNRAFENGFLKDEDGRISKGWADVVDSSSNNVFSDFDIHLVKNSVVVSETDAISGKR